MDMTRGLFGEITGKEPPENSWWVQAASGNAGAPEKMGAGDDVLMTTTGSRKVPTAQIGCMGAGGGECLVPQGSREAGGSGSLLGGDGVTGEGAPEGASTDVLPESFAPMVPPISDM